MRLQELLSVRTLIIAALPFLALPPLLLFPFLSFYTFYTNTIPTLHHSIPLSLTFPTGLLDTPLVTGTSALPNHVRPGTSYIVSVILKVPPTPPNLLLGNFMVRLKGLLPDSEELVEASRITYRTPWVRTLQTALWSPLYILNILREDETVIVEMGKIVLQEPRERIQIHIEGAPLLSTYECELELAAELYGWKAFLMRFKVPVAVVFMCMFVGIELVTAAWTWWRLAKWLELETEDEDEEPEFRVERRESHRGEIREPLDEPPPERSLLTPSPTPSLHEDEGVMGDDEGGISNVVGSTGLERRRSDGLRSRRRSP